MIVIKTQTVINGDEELGYAEVPDFQGLEVKSFQLLSRLKDGYWLVKVETDDEIPENMVIGEVE